MADEAPIDWREMFRRYADIVGMQEGVSFLERYQWSAEEWAALQAAGIVASDS
jgi:hypothetical protein